MTNHDAIGALCLQGSGEGKRGWMPWKCIWRGKARFAYMVLVRESAVRCIGSGSEGDGRALPTGFSGGKARSDAVEVYLAGQGALCLKGS